MGSRMRQSPSGGEGALCELGAAEMKESPPIAAIVAIEPIRTPRKERCIKPPSKEVTNGRRSEEKEYECPREEMDARCGHFTSKTSESFFCALRFDSSELERGLRDFLQDFFACGKLRGDWRATDASVDAARNGDGGVLGLIGGDGERTRQT